MTQPAITVILSENIIRGLLLMFLETNMQCICKPRENFTHCTDEPTSIDLKDGYRFQLGMSFWGELKKQPSIKVKCSTTR